MNVAPTSPPPVTPGQLLAGKYRVERVLGEGGMGIVVAAMNEMLAQRVAVKLLRPGALESHEATMRFLREARAAARLRSEHVARVLDTGSLEDGRPYMVMEHLDGKDLGDVIEHGPAPTVPQAVDYVLQVCEAIAEAHSVGIVHRDLKPRNLFLTRTVDGRPLVKVLDFGISKLEETGGHDMQLTKTTEVIGSPSYMSPEQLRSARYVDHRTDIWALGVILYELLSGRLPFYANTVTELVAVVLMEREPPLHALRADVPPALSNVIGRCLAKRPEERYGSVVELVHDLEAFAAGGAATAADRVRGVALASGKGLPPVAPSSGQLPPAIGSARSGGTSTAWADTHLEKGGSAAGAATAPSRTGTIAAAVAVGFLLAAGAGGTAMWFVRHARATTNASDEPSAPMPLPPGRKDLPPLPVATTPPGSGDVPAADAPPSGVAALPAPGAGTAATASASAPRGGPGRPPRAMAPAAPAGGAGHSDDPLTNIGRR